MIREGFTLAGKEDMAQPYYLFFQSLPHNFYAWFALILLGVVIWLTRVAMFGWAFIGTGLTIVAVVAAIFTGMYPNVMTSTIDPDYSLTVFNASSTTLTLQIMSIVALIFVPIVLVYQSWSYWVFRKRVGPRDVTTSTH